MVGIKGEYGCIFFYRTSHQNHPTEGGVPKTEMTQCRGSTLLILPEYNYFQQEKPCWSNFIKLNFMVRVYCIYISNNFMYNYITKTIVCFVTILIWFKMKNICKQQVYHDDTDLFHFLFHFTSLCFCYLVLFGFFFISQCCGAITCLQYIYPLLQMLLQFTVLCLLCYYATYMYFEQCKLEGANTFCQFWTYSKKYKNY